MWQAHKSKRTEWPAHNQVMDFAGLGLDPHGMRPASESRRAEWPASEGLTVAKVAVHKECGWPKGADDLSGHQVRISYTPVA